MKTISPEQAIIELQRVVPALHQEGHDAMERAVEIAYQRMTEFAPRGPTGRLASEVTHTVHATADGVAGLVRPRAPYAGDVEGGTGEGKVIRGTNGEAYSATGGLAISAADELADPFGVMTAQGYGAKIPGRKLALHVQGGTIFRGRVRGQRARGFVQRTREVTADEVEATLVDGAQRATDRLFKS